MRDNVKILGILNMVIGGLGLLVALGILVLFGGLAGVAGISADKDAIGGAAVLAGIGVFISVIIGLLSLPQMIGGWGLTKFSPWARTLMMVVSVLNLLHFPIGTAIGVYGIYVLFNDETKRLFATGGQVGFPPVQYPGQTAYPADQTSYPPPPPRL